MNNVKAIQKLNETELNLGVQSISKSWHNMYSDSAYIFIGGLDYGLTEGDVLSIFSQYGEIVNINLVRDRKSGKSKGFCFLAYEDQRSTVLAVDNFNGIKVCGRTIRVDHVAQYRRPKDEDGNEIIEKGCAPRTPTPSPTPPPESPTSPKKKKKKKKEKKLKEKKKKHKRSSDSSAESPVIDRVKQTRTGNMEEAVASKSKIIVKEAGSSESAPRRSRSHSKSRERKQGRWHHRSRSRSYSRGRERNQGRWHHRSRSRSYSRGRHKNRARLRSRSESRDRYRKKKRSRSRSHSKERPRKHKERRRSRSSSSCR